MYRRGPRRGTKDGGGGRRGTTRYSPDHEIHIEALSHINHVIDIAIPPFWTEMEILAAAGLHRCHHPPFTTRMFTRARFTSLMQSERRLQTVRIPSSPCSLWPQLLTCRRNIDPTASAHLPLLFVVPQLLQRHPRHHYTTMKENDIIAVVVVVFLLVLGLTMFVVFLYQKAVGNFLNSRELELDRGGSSRTSASG
jgi:uncharacterized membrane protein YhaH (DUF805 family)